MSCVAEAGDLPGAARRRPHAGEHGAPQENLRDDRQEPHQRAEPEVAAIDEPLFEQMRRIVHQV